MQIGGAGGGARRGVYVEHVAHVRDAGGVPVQRLVEGPRVLPRVASRAHGAGRVAGREAGGGMRYWGVCTQRAGERARDCRLGGHGAQGAAHDKHGAHALYAGGYQVQRLVEGLRQLPRVARGHTVRGGLRAGRREAAGDTGTCTQLAGERARVTADWGAGRAGSSARETCRTCS